jgi:hypothetical protein
MYLLCNKEKTIHTFRKSVPYTWSGGILNGGTWEWTDGTAMTWSLWHPTSVFTATNIYACFYNDGNIVPSYDYHRSYACQIKSAGILKLSSLASRSITNCINFLQRC